MGSSERVVSQASKIIDFLKYNMWEMFLKDPETYKEDILTCLEEFESVSLYLNKEQVQKESQWLGEYLHIFKKGLEKTDKLRIEKFSDYVKAGYLKSIYKENDGFWIDSKDFFFFLQEKIDILESIKDKTLRLSLTNQLLTLFSEMVGYHNKELYHDWDFKTEEDWYSDIRTYWKKIANLSEGDNPLNDGQHSVEAENKITEHLIYNHKRPSKETEYPEFLQKRLTSLNSIRDGTLQVILAEKLMSHVDRDMSWYHDIYRKGGTDFETEHAPVFALWEQIISLGKDSELIKKAQEQLKNRKQAFMKNQ